MDPVCVIAACSILVRSTLFVALGGAGVCDDRSSTPVPVVGSDGTDPTDCWAPYITEASRRFSVPELWIREVMRAESAGRASLDGRPITSRTGAMGLMQVMPRTYEELRARYGLGGDPYDPRSSILAGAAYLREMHDRYGWPGVIAAYNAGPERIDEYLNSGGALPAETQRYLAQVASAVTGSEPSERPATGQRLAKVSWLFADQPFDAGTVRRLGAATAEAPDARLAEGMPGPFTRVGEPLTRAAANGALPNSGLTTASKRRSRSAATAPSESSIFVPTLASQTALNSANTGVSAALEPVSEGHAAGLFTRQAPNVSVK